MRTLRGYTGFIFFLLCVSAAAQDASTGAIRGTVVDPAGARIAAARVVATKLATNREHSVLTGRQGEFSIQLLSPGDYSVSAEAAGMGLQVRPRVHVEVGGVLILDFRLAIAAVRETVTISGEAPLVEVQPSAVSSLLDERAITDLPINGRRFSDLALLTPGVTQDPRGLTSGSNGDLAFGGLRGWQTNFLVDGMDNNNAFFAQARGRYRAPYQFSNEVIQEFRVSSSTYGAELGRAGGAVINVVTKSGSNRFRGKGFYFLRDSSFNSQHPFVDFKPADRQQQFGFTLGGPVKRNKIFFFGGFDQHIFHVPRVVRFLNGASTLTAMPTDYEITDQPIVEEAAKRLSQLGGEFRSALVGNAGFLKLDFALTPRHHLAARLATSRYSGQNNVFFDPASPVTTFAITENGEERASTETAVASLTSALSFRATSHLRLQFSRDLQQSRANSEEVRTRIYDIIDAFGRSSILPRRTREHRLHLAETFSLERSRHSWKFGGDALLSWISNYFPMLFGGEYIFGEIRVNPWTFAPQTYGMRISPLRAWAHSVPLYYMQNFGSAESNPDTSEYAWFAQDSIRVTDHLALTLGVRYDLQTFSTGGLQPNPLWPGAGRVPRDGNNFAPRFGFSYAIGKDRPLVVRGGYGLFYTRIPSIYTSAIRTEDGLTRSHLFLRNTDYFDNLVFPKYPNPLAVCPTGANSCVAPAEVADRLTTEISAFATNFRTPSVHQASLSVEREVARRLSVGASYLYVRGQNLIRARDVNLPPPQKVSYPVFDESGTTYLGYNYEVDSFTSGLDPLVRPIRQVGSINVFESAASSIYHGLTISAQRRMSRGLYFRLAYTWAHAIDDGQDALIAGSPVTVQNSYSPASERGASVTDQRHRFVFAWSVQPKPLAKGSVLQFLFRNWRFSGVTTVGSGRPVNARVVGDANRDGNTDNDRLPGVQRNSFTGPGYATTDLRISRRIHLRERFRMEFLAESFNLLNRANKRLDITDDGFQNAAVTFVEDGRTVNSHHYPAHYRLQAGFLRPTKAYAPRQVQFGVRVSF